MADQHSAAAQDVFDIANWLERATTRHDPQPRVAAEPAAEEYVPRHRADVAADSVA